jgi:glycerol-3-phosphate acyltransferase PlsY
LSFIGLSFVGSVIGRFGLLVCRLLALLVFAGLCWFLLVFAGSVGLAGLLAQLVCWLALLALLVLALLRFCWLALVLLVLLLAEAHENAIKDTDNSLVTRLIVHKTN